MGALRAAEPSADRDGRNVGLGSTPRSHAAALRTNVGPAARCHSARTPDMTLYFACPTAQHPAGGVHKIFQFAAALDQAGFPSVVVHPSGSTPMEFWFEPAARSLGAEQVTFDVGADLLVLPEYGAFDAHLPDEAALVVLAQAPYSTLADRPFPESATPLSALDLGPYVHPGLRAVVCVSADSERFLRFTFPQVDVRRVHVGIDLDVFSPGPRWRDRRLACMPRRRGAEMTELLHMLASRGRVAAWAPQFISGSDERGVAAALRACPIFLSFSGREGFGLPPLEAMASGCIVIGYTGRGGDEFFLPELAYAIPDGDNVEYARVVEAVVDEYEGRSERIVAMSAAAAEHVRSEYTLERQDREIVDVFASLVGERGSSASSAARFAMTDILPRVRGRGGRARVAVFHARAALRAASRRSP